MKKAFILKTAALLTLFPLFSSLCLTSCGDETANGSESVSAVEKENEVMLIRDISSVELVKEIKVGWNLGNTLDATGSTVNSETGWGNPKTTFEIIQAVKDKGFNIVRIPVTWYSHTGDAPDYKIDEDWLNRVNEVVDYVLDNGMFCILNSHHEEWMFPSYEKEEENAERLTALWTQVAERFKNYDEKLIFEGLNEPRWKNTEFEWSGGNEEGWEVVNRLNAVFVETVRGTGGNNELRHLMLPSYAASAEPKAYKALKLPENDDKIIVSIHSYTPYTMALAAGGKGMWLPDRNGATDPIDNLFKGLKETFTDNGIAVIIGEMGARNKDNLGYRVLWADYYIGRSREYGIPCLFWDNGAFYGGGELFGLLDRYTLTWTFGEIADAMVNAANEGKPLLSHITDIAELGIEE